MKRKRPTKTTTLKVLRRAVREQNPDLFFKWAKKKLYGET